MQIKPTLLCQELIRAEIEYTNSLIGKGSSDSYQYGIYAGYSGKYAALWLGLVPVQDQYFSVEET